MFVETQLVYYNVIGFIRKSHSAYARNQKLLGTFLNPLSIELKLRGERSKTCSQQKIFCVFVIMTIMHLFDILALKNKVFGHFDPSYCVLFVAYY